MKTFPTQKVGKLILNKVPDRQWQVISVDMIGELPESHGNNAILVVVDRLSKRIHAIPTVTSLDSEGVARLFLENVVDVVIVRPMQREGDRPLEPRIHRLHPTPFSRVPIPF